MVRLSQSYTAGFGELFRRSYDGAGESGASLTDCDASLPLTFYSIIFGPELLEDALLIERTSEFKDDGGFYVSVRCVIWYPHSRGERFTAKTDTLAHDCFTRLVDQGT